ncbi:MAG: universal stress protein [Gammaproteobacteria bacterium]|nr:universal stress protein [Gammaproteobacteria bacterium]
MKDLIVHVEGSTRCTARIDYAARMAQRFNARLVGVYASQAPVMPLDDGLLQGLEGAVTAPESGEYDVQIAHAESEAAEETFKRCVARHAVTARWRTMAGGAADVMIAYARFADLAIVSQTHAGSVDIAADVALRAGRPVLVVPHTKHLSADAGHVMVAWDASREAARALHDAMPLLRAALRVTLLSIGPAEKMPPGVDIVEHLAAYGVHVESEQDDGGERERGRCLMARAAARRCDLIVMGAYGHSPLRQRMLGGTSSYVLKHMTVPVLMSH